MSNRMCRVTVGNETKTYPEGTCYGEIVKDFSSHAEYPVVLVMAEGKLRELHKKVHRDCRISLITTADSIGHKTYKRSMNLLFLKAVYHVAGHEKIRKVVLRFAVDAGFYYTIEGDVTVDQTFLDQVDAYMRSLVEQKLPVMKRSISTADAIELFHRHGMYDKEKLFRFRRVSRVNIYRLEDFEDYYYGYMVWHTGYLKYFRLYPYENGVLLQMPRRKNPQVVPEFVPSPRFSRCRCRRNAGAR